MNLHSRTSKRPGQWLCAGGRAEAVKAAHKHTHMKILHRRRSPGIGKIILQEAVFLPIESPQVQATAAAHPAAMTTRRRRG